MSVPGCLLDDDEVFCEVCGLKPRAYGQLCWACKADNADVYCDAAYQDSVEGR